MKNFFKPTRTKRPAASVPTAPPSTPPPAPSRAREHEHRATLAFHRIMQRGSNVVLCQCGYAMFGNPTDRRADYDARHRIHIREVEAQLKAQADEGYGGSEF